MVAYDGVGAGAQTSYGGSTSSGTLSWSHTTGAGSNLGAIVAVACYSSSSSGWYPSAPSSSNVTVKWGSTSMTYLGVKANGYSSLLLYSITGLAASTTSTITVSMSTTAYNYTDTAYFEASSVSYSGVASISGFTSSSGTSTTASVSETTTSGSETVAAIMAYNANLSSPTRTRRYLYNSEPRLLLTDNASSGTSTTHAATVASSSAWIAAAANITSASTAWTGGSTSTFTGGNTPDGVLGITGTTSTTETFTATQDGVRGASSGAASTWTFGTIQDGIRGVVGMATSSWIAAMTVDGWAGESAFSTWTFGATQDGIRGTSSGAASTFTQTTTVNGTLVIQGVASTTEVITTTADGVRGAVSGATSTFGFGCAATGYLGEVGGSTSTFTLGQTVNGQVAGRSLSSFTMQTTAKGIVGYADGRLDLTETDPADAFARANAFFTENWSPPTSLDVRLHDTDGYMQLPLGDYISTTCTYDRNVPGTGTIQLKGTDPGGALAMTCKYATVPVTIRTDNWKWTGRVKDCTDDTVNGVNTYTLQLIDDLSWAGKMLVFPTWWSPVEFQPITEAFYIGPAVSSIKSMFAEQILRLYYLDLVYDFINNIGQPAAMFATLFAQYQDGFMPPIVVVPTDVLTDTSKWTCIQARMVTCDTVIAAALKDCGLRLKIWMWEPGDDQPTDAFTLTVPTIVIDVIDETNVQGITGTMLDGLIGTAVEFADTSFGAIITAMTGIDYSESEDTDNTNPYAGILSGLLGLNSKPPWVIYEDGPYTAITESHVGAHTPLAYTVMTGGSSPTWVNDLINLLLEALLSAILAYAGVFGIPDNLLDGILDNIFLAFMQVEDVQRRLDAGKFAWPEALTKSGGQAWTPDALISLEEGLWDTRGQYTFQFMVADGFPYRFGFDFDIGSAVSFVYKNVIYTDYLDTVVFLDDRSNCVKSTLTVGDNNPLESPWAKIARYIQGVDDVVKYVTLQGTS